MLDAVRKDSIYLELFSQNLTSGVSFTGLVGYPSDDINKFLWMVRIGGGVFPHIKEPDYLVSTLHTTFL